MCKPYIPSDSPILRQVLEAFPLPATLLGAVHYGQGHINDTYCVLCQPEEGDCVRFILQGINSTVFPQPEALMDNFCGITGFLRRKISANGGDPLRETLSVIPTKTGADYFRDSTGQLWRLMPFIEQTDCFQSATPALFEASARAFGRFQYMLQDYPAETLHETIPNFHNTEDRFAKFERAVQADPLGRAGSAAKEIQFVMDRKADCSVALQAQRENRLPLRVTHNDTKLNNILIDRKTGEGVCIIDLDTTMPGLSINDFGDSIRFGANHCAEDEQDLSKVNFDIELFEVYTRGFLEGANGSLTEAELQYLPWGARLMTLECGIRFLTDYLEGDHYFRIHYPDQNLYRCRTQFKLVGDMENSFTAMNDIVAKYAK